MVPQLYITVYKEQFRSPGRVKREQLRPTSAHRRNNPQPRPDFLFPRSLQSINRSTHAFPHPSPPVNLGRPLFPPVRHLSFHSPVATCSDSYLNTANSAKPQHMPPVNQSTGQVPPSADRLQKLQLTEPSPNTDIQLSASLKSPQSRLGYQKHVHPLSAQQLRQNPGAQTRAQTPAAPCSAARTKHLRCCSNSARDNSSGCYSCFHVVKPYQAGHYVIHPEFVSESLY